MHTMKHVDVTFTAEHFNAVRSAAVKRNQTIPAYVRWAILKFLGISKNAPADGKLPEPMAVPSDEVSIVMAHLRPIPTKEPITKTKGYLIGYFAKVGGMSIVFDQHRMGREMAKGRYLVAYFGPSKEQDPVFSGYQTRDEAVKVARITALAERSNEAGGHCLIS